MCWGERREIEREKMRGTVPKTVTAATTKLPEDARARVSNEEI